MFDIVGDRQIDGASTLVAAVVGTLAVQVLAGETPGANFGQSVVTFGGSVALASAAADIVAPRVQSVLGVKPGLVCTATRCGTVFGVSYGLFMLAGAPSIMGAGGAAIGCAAGEYVYGMLQDNAPGAFSSLGAVHSGAGTGGIKGATNF